MEMQQVRYFLALSKTLNFTRAAEECHVTQPALTRSIKQLEEELGGALIRRERTHSHLTELGRRMLPMLQQCYDAAVSAKLLAKAVQYSGRRSAERRGRKLREHDGPVADASPNLQEPFREQSLRFAVARQLVCWRH